MIPKQLSAFLMRCGFLLFGLMLLIPAANAQQVLVEAEQFNNTGGWDVDQQFIDQMGSSYLLAHGLGVPVKDAVTKVKFTNQGIHRVWVRTRDWVAPWKAPGAPGKFRLLVNGNALAVTFGTKGEEWHWQDGGLIDVMSETKFLPTTSPPPTVIDRGLVEDSWPVVVTAETTLALHDLTGFEGRCDAVLFSSDLSFVPPNSLEELSKLRAKLLGLPAQPDDGGSFDLVVVGGGVAGISAAVSGARNGLKVALVQDRPVLGGNSSSEVRVWPEGHTCQKPYTHIGEIVEEICPRKTAESRNAAAGAVFDDQRKLRVVRAEKNITLLLEHRVNAVEQINKKIVSVTAVNIRSARAVKLSGKFFVDCTGDGTVGFLAGADYMVSHEGNMGSSNLWNVLDVADPSQVFKCECKDKDALSMSADAGLVAAPFPRVPWALDLSDKPFPGRNNYNPFGSKKPLENLGGWFWESGFDKDPINDVERIRDLNMRAMYGAWDALKNVDGLYPNHRIGWSAFIAGKRESRRLTGDVVLSGDDFHQAKVFPDAAYPCTWHIDVHSPHPEFDKELKGEEFISTFTRGEEYSYAGPYWAPYRTLYSRNIGNLFMAGRDISVTREALGAVRVMRTTGMMGEIVGKAAWICVRHETTPRGVYESHLPLLKELMAQPSAARRETVAGSLTLPTTSEK